MELQSECRSTLREHRLHQQPHRDRYEFFRLDAGHAIQLWDSNTGDNTRTLTGHTDIVYTLAYNRDGTQLVSGGQDTTVRIWDVATGENTRTLNGHTDTVTTVAYSPDGKHIASGGHDDTLRIDAAE